jgi:hypothetical protein
MHCLQRDPAAQARRLLRVLLLRVCQVPAETDGGWLLHLTAAGVAAFGNFLTVSADRSFRHAAIAQSRQT